MKVHTNTQRALFGNLCAVTMNKASTRTKEKYEIREAPVCCKYSPVNQAT